MCRDLLDELESFAYTVDIEEANPSNTKPSGFGYTFHCCAGRSKPMHSGIVDLQQQPQPIWDTADLSWLHFQRRRWTTLWLMKTVYSRLKTCEDISASDTLSEVEQQHMWHETHKLNAREMREHAEQVKGCFIKAGQVMSAMVGVLPDPYTDEFLSLTDHLPVSSIEEVFGVVRRDLKRAPRDVFSDFDPMPIASASIAQVHRARLRSTGEVVAVKVQHAGVDRLFTEDCSTLAAVARQVAFWSPDLDFRSVIEDMSEALPHELDFRHERRALDRAGEVLRRAGSPCVVPRVHADLFGPHIFVMDFVDATPIVNLADPEYCEAHSLEKYTILRSLLEAFGTMAFKDGLFHSDPHAGNIRLLLDPSSPGGARPVIFDWGLHKQFTDDERLGVAKVFYSLANLDVVGLFDALGNLGFSFKPEMVTDEFRREFLEKARSAMKDTVSRETARANVRHEMREYKERLDRAAQDGAPLQGSYSPIYFLEELPKCVVSFMRMLQILRGLCVAAEAQGMPVLQVLSEQAREALQEGSRCESLAGRLRLFTGRARRRAAPAPGQSSEGALERRVRLRLRDLASAQRVVGAQVAVICGATSCDIAAGSLSTTDARPVEGRTRFPLMGATPGIAALALLRCLRRRGCALSAPVAALWPAFPPEVTLSELLSHAAGLQSAFPRDFKASHLDDVEAMARHLERLPLRRSERRVAYLLQAFALAKLGDCVALQGDLLHWLGAELGPLGLDAAAPAGHGGDALICRDLPELARVSMVEVQAGRDRRAQREEGGSAGPVPLLEALCRDPLAFDPLQGNAALGGVFRGGLSLGASAMGLASALSSAALREDLEATGALEAAGADGSALGWCLTGGATDFTSGGLQRVEARGRLGRRYQGYGVVCGFGPCVLHFPELAGGLTIAVTVNDVIHGRAAAAELVAEVLAHYGCRPLWTEMPMRTKVDAMRLATSSDLEPLVSAMGGLQALQASLSACRGVEGAAERASRCGLRAWGNLQTGRLETDPLGRGARAGRGPWHAIRAQLSHWSARVCCPWKV